MQASNTGMLRKPKELEFLQSNIKLVIFDMDGVLCRYNFNERLRILSEVTGLPAADIDAAIFRSGFDDQGDLGLYSAEDYLTQFSERLGVSVSRDDWLRARRDSIAPDGAMLELAAQVGCLAPIAMLTNNGPLLQDGFSEVFPQAAALFGEQAFFSSQLKSTKEKPEIFRLILTELGGKPNSTLFIDDTPAYIASAQKAALLTHHFRCIHGLRDVLLTYGISIGPA